MGAAVGAGVGAGVGAAVGSSLTLKAIVAPTVRNRTNSCVFIIFNFSSLNSKLMADQNVTVLIFSA